MRKVLLSILLSAATLHAQIITGGHRKIGIVVPVASATVTQSCAIQETTNTSIASCSVPTTAGQLVLTNFNFFDTHTINVTSSCGGTLSLVPVTPPFPDIWNDIFYDYVYAFTNVNANANCIITATDTATPGSTPWISVVAIGGCVSLCGVDTASSMTTNSTSINTIVATSINTTVANELIITFSALKNQSDSISPSNSPQPMTVLRQPSSGILVASSVAAVAGPNFTQCIDTFSFGDNAVHDIVSVK
jgi:hypothetical protein